MNDDALTTLAQSLRGALIKPGDPEYEEARKLYNAMIDKRPLAIARCADVADVIAAVNFGRDNKLPIAIRGGGHNGPGLGSVDNGWAIDLSAMKGESSLQKSDSAGGPGLDHRRSRSRNRGLRPGRAVRNHSDNRRRRSHAQRRSWLPRARPGG